MRDVSSEHRICIEDEECLVKVLPHHFDTGEHIELDISGDNISLELSLPIKVYEKIIDRLNKLV